MNRKFIIIIAILAASVFVISPATADTTTFTWTQGTGSDYLTVSFVGTVGEGNVTSWDWNFGDSGSSSLQSPSHQYSEVDTFTVTLTTTFDDNTTETKTQNVDLSEPPLVACFTASVTNGDAPLTVSFTDLTIGEHDSSWDFDDLSDPVNTQNPTHTFEIPDTYTVVLTATNSSEVNDQYEVNIQVNYPTPVALFTSNVTSGNPPLSVQFNDTSTISYGEITGWAWDFNNDGTTDSTTQNPTYTYSTIGNYSVKLTVTSGGSKTNTFTDTGHIIVTSGLTASFSANKTSGDNPLSVKFTSTTPTDLEIESYHWDFGDDDDSNEANPVHTYNFLGDYDVTLSVTDSTGETYTLTKSDYITVENKATATPTPTPTPTQTAKPTYIIEETEEATLTAVAVQNGTKIFGIPGTEFFRGETVKFHGFYKEWMLLLKGLFGMS